MAERRELGGVELTRGDSASPSIELAQDEGTNPASVNSDRQAKAKAIGSISALLSSKNVAIVEPSAAGPFASSGPESV